MTVWPFADHGGGYGSNPAVATGLATGSRPGPALAGSHRMGRPPRQRAAITPRASNSSNRRAKGETILTASDVDIVPGGHGFVYDPCRSARPTTKTSTGRMNSLFLAIAVALMVRSLADAR
ncbi:hypothetical protein, partial [Kutzneria kofuensis]|uniref:hypothetical protein n=1 Tax=Kutzneria kofuensis TaxID=103725 RepID=UPI0031E84EFB